MVLAEGSDKCVVSETAGIGPSYISVPGPLARPLTYPRSLTAGRARLTYGGTGSGASMVYLRVAVCVRSGSLVTSRPSLAVGPDINVVVVVVVVVVVE